MSTSNLGSVEAERAWIAENMPLSVEVAQRLPDMSSVRLACCVHLRSNMGPAFRGFLQRKAALFVTTCNPDTVDDDFVAYLRCEGATVVAHTGMSVPEWEASLHEAVAWGPTHLCDMGAHLTMHMMVDARGLDTLHRATGAPIQAALEATGTGAQRLRDLPHTPVYPVYNWDHVRIKTEIHNRHMVGLTLACAFYETTQLTFHGRRVLVVGGGAVGQGVAESARHFGALGVTVAEIDYGRAAVLQFRGFQVASPASRDPRWLDKALGAADVIITATGARHVIGMHNIACVKPNAILANVGHARDEIDVQGLLAAFESQPVLPGLDRIIVDPAKYPTPGPQSTKAMYIMAQGSMANLACGRGDSLNAFDITLATMIAGVGFICDATQSHTASTLRGLHPLPEAVYQPVAQLQVELYSRGGGGIVSEDDQSR